MNCLNGFGSVYNFYIVWEVMKFNRICGTHLLRKREYGSGALNVDLGTPSSSPSLSNQIENLITRKNHEIKNLGSQNSELITSIKSDITSLKTYKKTSKQIINSYAPIPRMILSLIILLSRYSIILPRLLFNSYVDTRSSDGIIKLFLKFIGQDSYFWEHTLSAILTACIVFNSLTGITSIYERSLSQYIPTNSKIPVEIIATLLVILTITISFNCVEFMDTEFKEIIGHKGERGVSGFWGDLGFACFGVITGGGLWIGGGVLERELFE